VLDLGPAADHWASPCHSTAASQDTNRSTRSARKDWSSKRLPTECLQSFGVPNSRIVESASSQHRCTRDACVVESWSSPGPGLVLAPDGGPRDLPNVTRRHLVQEWHELLMRATEYRMLYDAGESLVGKTNLNWMPECAVGSASFQETVCQSSWRYQARERASL
jgi:hypothetical protein